MFPVVPGVVNTAGMGAESGTETISCSPGNPSTVSSLGTTGYAAEGELPRECPESPGGWVAEAEAENGPKSFGAPERKRKAGESQTARNVDVGGDGTQKLGVSRRPNDDGASGAGPTTDFGAGRVREVQFDLPAVPPRTDDYLRPTRTRTSQPFVPVDERRLGSSERSRAREQESSVISLGA